MWEMRRDSEKLELDTKRPMKGISVLPQNNSEVGSVRLDTFIMSLIYKKLIQGEEEKTTAKFLKSLEGQWTTWGAFFDLDKIQRLRPAKIKDSDEQK